MVGFESWMNVEVPTLIQRWTTNVVQTFKSRCCLNVDLTFLTFTLNFKINVYIISIIFVDIFHHHLIRFAILDNISTCWCITWHLFIKKQNLQWNLNSFISPTYSETYMHYGSLLEITIGGRLSMKSAKYEIYNIC